MTKVPITVYINKEIKDMLSRRHVSISSWVRSSINLKMGKERIENTPKYKEYKLKFQRKYRKENKFIINAIMRYYYQSIREAAQVPLGSWICSRLRSGLRR